jgi:RNA polymerase sigma factor (sigma-70 family)
VNEKQFKELVIPISNKLLGLSYAILGNKDDAKDCLQDVFIRLWNNRKALINVHNIEAFAYTITRNACLDRIRSKKEMFDINKIMNEPIGIDLATDNENEDVRIGLINKVLVKLNDVQQKVFIMRDIERVEFPDIAKELNINEENVRVTLSRARKKIKELVENEIKFKALVK